MCIPLVRSAPSPATASSPCNTDRFASGLISGYYDNKAEYNRIPQRIRQLRTLARLLGQDRLDRLAIYAENNIGALAGNFFFGVLLGSTALIGFLLGLPLDIRHVTFAAANFAYGLVALEHAVTWRTVGLCVAGLVGIGIVNLGVSFSLAIYVAMRSRRAAWGNWGDLLRRMLHLCATPRRVLPAATDGVRRVQACARINGTYISSAVVPPWTPTILCFFSPSI